MRTSPAPVHRNRAPSTDRSAVSQQRRASSSSRGRPTEKSIPREPSTHTAASLSRHHTMSSSPNRRVEFADAIWATIPTPHGSAQDSNKRGGASMPLGLPPRGKKSGAVMVPCRVIVTALDVTVMSEQKSRPEVLAVLKRGHQRTVADMLSPSSRRGSSTGLEVLRFGRTEIGLNPTRENVRLHFGEDGVADNFFDAVSQNAEIDLLPSAAEPAPEPPAALTGKHRRASSTSAASPSVPRHGSQHATSPGVSPIFPREQSAAPRRPDAQRRLQLYRAARDAVTEQIKRDQALGDAIQSHEREVEDGLSTLANLMKDRDRRRESILNKQQTTLNDLSTQLHFQQLSNDASSRRAEMSRQQDEYQLSGADRDLADLRAAEAARASNYLSGATEINTAEFDEARHRAWTAHQYHQAEGDVAWGDIRRALTSMAASETKDAVNRQSLPLQERYGVVRGGSSAPRDQREQLLGELHDTLDAFTHGGDQHQHAAAARRGPSHHRDANDANQVHSPYAEQRRALLDDISLLMGDHQRDASAIRAAQEQADREAAIAEAAGIKREEALAAERRRGEELEREAQRQRAEAEAKLAAQRAEADAAAAAERAKAEAAAQVEAARIQAAAITTAANVTEVKPAELDRAREAEEKILAALREPVKEPLPPRQPTPEPVDDVPAPASPDPSPVASALPPPTPASPTAASDSSKSSVWVKKVDPKGRPYYFNTETRKTSWTNPDESAPATPASPTPSASSGEWIEKKDPKGRTYYYNSVTKKTTWTKPSGSGEPATPASPTPSASAAASPRASSEWVEKKDPKGRTYYYNAVTKKTTWSKPEGFEELTSPTLSLASPVGGVGSPSGEWIEKKDPKGRTYYYNSATKKTSWTKPTGADSAAPASPTPSAAASPTAASGEWVEKKDPKGRTYYYNLVTKKTTWTKPTGSGEPATPASPTPSASSREWVEKKDPKGRTYYYNSATKKTTWTKPA